MSALNYTLIEANDSHQFENNVCRLLQSGWTLQGGLVVTALYPKSSCEGEENGPTYRYSQSAVRSSAYVQGSDIDDKPLEIRVGLKAIDDERTTFMGSDGLQWLLSEETLIGFRSTSVRSFSGVRAEGANTTESLTTFRRSEATISPFPMLGTLHAHAGVVDFDENNSTELTILEVPNGSSVANVVTVVRATHPEWVRGFWRVQIALEEQHYTRLFCPSCRDLSGSFVLKAVVSAPQPGEPDDVMSGCAFLVDAHILTRGRLAELCVLER
jgi:hypothetical protein